MNASAKTEAKTADSEEMGAISAEIAKLRAELSGVIETVGRVTRERADAIAGSDAVTYGIAAGEAAVADLSGELRRIEEDIAASTRNSPWRALGIAALIGFAAGVLFRR